MCAPLHSTAEPEASWALLISVVLPRPIDRLYASHVDFLSLTSLAAWSSEKSLPKLLAAGAHLSCKPGLRHSQGSKRDMQSWPQATYYCIAADHKLKEHCTSRVGTEMTVDASGAKANWAFEMCMGLGGPAPAWHSKNTTL